MAKKGSECYRRYGNEWSRALTDVTRECFLSIFAGPVKHIAGKGERYAIERTFLSFDEYGSIVPEEEKDKAIFLFTFTEFDPFFMGISGLAFDIAYENVDEMIADGWAID